jgi:hypothetical protein
MKTLNLKWITLLIGAVFIQSCSVSDLTVIKRKQKKSLKGDQPLLTDDQLMEQLELSQSILSRNVGPELEPQFKAVFPRKTIPALNYLAYKKLVRDGGIDPNYETENPAIKPLNDPSRSQGVAAQLAWEKLIDGLCAQTQETSDENSNAIFKPDDALLLGTGEQYPTDPAMRKIFIAVRRAWRAPLKESDSALLSLKKNYDLAKSKMGEANADRALCEAVMLAPQFWLGAGGPSEPARKVYQRLASRLPSIRELETYTTGKRSLADIVKSIQVNESEKYLDNLWRWHDWQLGFSTNLFPNEVGNTTYFGVSHLPYNGSSKLYSNWGRNYSMQGYALKEENGLLYSKRLSVQGAACDDYEESFDPRTAGLAYYYRGQLLARRMIMNVPGIGSGDQSFNVNGVQFSPDDFRQSFRYESPAYPIDCEDPSGSNTCFYHKFADGSKLAQAFGGAQKIGSFNDSLRVYRVTPAGALQAGYSRVKMFYGGEVKVCNSLMRPLLTCGGIKVPDVTFGSLLNPDAWNGLHCGKPDVNALKSVSADYLIPNGYNVNQNLNSGSLNDVILGQPSIEFSGNFREYIWTKNRQMSSQMYPYMQLLDDLHREPERFIKYLIKNNLDYRELISGEWTIGSEYYKLFIAANGLPLMAYPPGYEKYSNSSSRAPIEKRYTESEIDNSVITQKDALPISMNYVYKNGISGVRNKEDLAFDSWSTNGVRREQNQYSLWKSEGEFSPRPLSGILTMPAFIQPTISKARTYSARIFQRLLCRLPSEVKVPDSMKSAHVKFIPTREPGGMRHVDQKKGCFSCHVSLDPLAAAVSSSFMNRVGETENVDFLGELLPSGGDGAGAKTPDTSGLRWGSYNARGEGMFQGKQIRGFQEMGKAVSESDEFAECSVLTAFKNVFGRDPSEEDIKLINIIKRKFKTNYNYNQMISDLVSSPMFKTTN